MFEYFSSNYPWNLTVALSIGMGGELSEIADACRPLVNVASGASRAAATEAWRQSWSVVAQRLERLAGDAETRGWAFSAGEYYLRASNYYLVAERMMSWTDPRRLASYRRALAAFEKGYRLSGHRAERIEVTNQEGAPLAAYLRLPPGEGPFPALIFFNGFDSIKEMHYLLYADDAVKRGVAILFIDQEGTGEAMRLHDIKKRVDAEMSVAPFIDYLSTRDEIDSDRIGVAGISNGGYDAPRAAAFDERLKCVACLGAFYNADDYLGRFSGGGADKVVHGLSDLDDHMMKVMGAPEVEAAYRLFAKRNLDGVLGRLRVPLLVLHGENDRQVPLWHADRTVAEAVNSPQVEYKVFSLSEGSAEHCGIDNAGMHANYLFDWVAQALKGATFQGSS
jgi:dipeptidyl aminopeptidase/acylaminoacyl peptidase